MHATATLVTNECSGCGVYIIRTHAPPRGTLLQRLARWLFPRFFAGERGDERTYTWSCVAKISGDTAELYGVLTAPTRAERVAVMDKLKSLRVERVEWERRTGCGRRRTGVKI